MVRAGCDPDYISMSYGLEDRGKARQEYRMALQLKRSGHIAIDAHLTSGSDGSQFIVRLTERGRLSL